MSFGPSNSPSIRGISGIQEDSPTLVWSTCGIHRIVCLGDWFVAHEPDDQAGDWDAYLLFGPQATWTSQPPPLISSGGSVIDTKDQLAQSIAPLLKG